MEKLKPKYHLGKIVNKYLIVEILAFAYNERADVIFALQFLSKQMRVLLKENYRFIRKIF